MHRLTVPPLSVFGRCAGVSAYALQLKTYHWEHGGLPTGGEAAQLESWAAAVGDRRVSPLAPNQRLTGVPRQLLYGAPCTGGFGLLPLTLHTRAREAVWAARLARTAGRPAGSLNSNHPWARITALYLRRHHPLLSPSSVLTMDAASGAGPHPGAEPLPGDIRRILVALSHLPPVQDVDTTPLPAPGDWCFNVPLWGNPILPNSAPAAAGEGGQGSGGEADDDTEATLPAVNANAAAADPDFVPEDEELMAANGLPRPGLDCRHTRLAACTALRTVGDAVRVGRAAVNAPQGAGWEQWVQAHLAPQEALGLRRGPTLNAIRSLLTDISADWRAAAAAVLDHPERAERLDSEETIRAMLVERVGWRLGGLLSIKLRSLTVRIATQLQLQAVTARRARLHAAYEQAAREQEPAAPASGDQPATAEQASCVPALLRRLWPIKWEREHKETLWRLAVDGVPLPGNSHLHSSSPEPCGCGGYGGGGPQPCSPRAHHFWACPVAQAVVQQITTYVPGPINRAHVWLAEAPPGVQQCVWDIISLAALSAMERARVGLRAASRQAPAHDAEAGLAAPAPIEVAKSRAVLEFWQRLQGFAELGLPRRGWEGVGSDHPILAVVGGRVQCVHPVGLEVEGADGE